MFIKCYPPLDFCFAVVLWSASIWADNKVRGASAGESFVGGDCFSKKNLPFFFFFFEDVYRFPGSGPVMDSNAAKEIIHSCPITTYEAPINTRSPEGSEEGDRDRAESRQGRVKLPLKHVLFWRGVDRRDGPTLDLLFTFCQIAWRPFI